MVVSEAVRQEAIKLVQREAAGRRISFEQVKADFGEALAEQITTEARRIKARTTSIATGTPESLRQSEELRLAERVRFKQAGRVGRTREEFLATKEGERFRPKEDPPREQITPRKETRLDISPRGDEPVKQVGGVFLKEREAETIGKPSVRSFFFGETGKQFIGVGIPGTPVTLFSAEQIKKTLKKTPGIFGFPVRAGAELIPITPVETGFILGVGAVSVLAPPIISGGIFAGIGGISVKQALDPTLTPEQRVASGFVGGLAGVGLIAGATPFVRGLGAKPLKVSERGFQVIKDVKGIGDIGIIPRGSPLRTGETIAVKLPKISPLVRGGFDVRPGQKGLFLGKDQLLGTSQIGLFKPGKDIPIERPFFVTPQEPFIKIPETRISRLGLVDLFKTPRETEIKFGFPKAPQIAITKGAVGRREAPGVFEIGKGTELEAIKTRGLITDVEKIGRAKINFQGVDIFTFKVGDVRAGRLKGISQKDLFSTRPTTRVSGESVLSSLFASIKTRPSSFDLSLLTGFRPPPRRTQPPTTKRDFSFLFPPTRPPTRRTTPTSSLTFPGFLSLTPGGFFFDDPTKTPRIFDSERKPPKKKKRTLRKLRKDIRVSFTSIIADLRAVKFPKEIAIGGISPRELRTLPRRPRRIKKR